MKTIQNLTGVAVEAAAPSNLHIGFGIMDQPVPGFMRQLSMGITGMHLTAPGGEVFIPTEALWALAEAADPVFRPPPLPPAKAARPSGK